MRHEKSVRGRDAAAFIDSEPGGGCSAIAAWQAMALRIARSDCAVLLTGETGSGKGYVARWMHARSQRGGAGRPYVPVNCGAIPEALIDSQLFGHARGAFSGADREHLGLVRAAEGGTLLLDEVADLPLTAQSRLLRLLEEREVQPVGHSRPLRVNVRIIAATSADLHARVREGSFRQDLLFRLDVVRLHLPPLRERTSEIMPLLQMFNEEFARLYRQPLLQFDRAALRAIECHDWAGNVRELRTLIERLQVMCGDVDARGGTSTAAPVVTAADLQRHAGLREPAATSRGSAAGLRVGPAAVRLLELKLETVNQALSACNGNMSRAASTLGVHRSTLYRWLANQQRLSA